MGGCCCSSRKAQLHGAPMYFYCSPALEEEESLTSHDVAASAITAELLVDLDLVRTTPDTYRSPPTPLPYDIVFGCPPSTDSDSVRETISCSSFGTSATCGDVEEADCKVQDNSLPVSPKKLEISKSKDAHVLAEEDKDVCPICLEEYETENPDFITKCEHHYHLSCILEWMERSDTCPICDQVYLLQQLQQVIYEVTGYVSTSFYGNECLCLDCLGYSSVGLGQEVVALKKLKLGKQ